MKKGFTLLEMVIVFLVITVLLLLTIPRIQKVFHIIDAKGCEAQLKIIDSAIIQYMLIHDNPPSSTSELVNEDLISARQTTCQGGQVIDIVDGEAHVQS